MIYQVYHRYGRVYFDKHDAVKSAMEYNQGGEDAGELSSAGVIDTEGKVVYLPEIGGETRNSKSSIVKLAKTEMGLDLSEYEFRTYPRFAD